MASAQLDEITSNWMALNCIFERSPFRPRLPHGTYRHDCVYARGTHVGLLMTCPRIFRDEMFVYLVHPFRVPLLWKCRIRFYMCVQRLDERERYAFLNPICFLSNIFVVLLLHSLHLRLRSLIDTTTWLVHRVS